MCRKLHAKISRCDKYSRPSWIRQQDIDNDARWSQPAHLEWPIDLAAFNKDFETLTEPVEHVDDNDPTILQLWEQYWPPELRESTIDDAELGPWKLKHFAPVNYLFPTPSAKECKERILAALNVQPFPPKPDQVIRRSLFMVDGIQLPPLPPAVSTMNHPFILGWAYTTEWWECFVEASWEQTGDEPPSRFFRSITDTGFGDLKARLGPLRTAVFVSMAVRADLPLRDDVVFDMFFDQLPIADVIGIVCTDSQRHYCSRVDAGTYQWLKTILGEPAWFRYPFSLETWHTVQPPF